jgi:hypothetical protein
MIKYLAVLCLTLAQNQPFGHYVRPAPPAAEALPREIQDQVEEMPGRTKAETDDPTLPPEIKEDVENWPKARKAEPEEDDEEAEAKPRRRRPPPTETATPAEEAPPVPASTEGETDSATPAPRSRFIKKIDADPTVKKPVTKKKKKKGQLALGISPRGITKLSKVEQQRQFEKEAAADADEADRLSRQAEREAQERERRSKKSKKKKNGTAPVSTAALVPGVSVEASPNPNGPLIPGTKKSKRGRKKLGNVVLDPTAPVPTVEESGGKKRHSRRHDDFARTGEEAPIATNSGERTAGHVVRTGPAVASVLTGILQGLVDHPRMPTERDLGFTYLGYIGDKSRQKELLKNISDPKVDDAEKLPLLAALVDAYGDKSHTAELIRIVDNPKNIPFQKLWALEILGRAGDRSRTSVLQGFAHDRNGDQSDRLRALMVLADLGESSAKEEAKQLSADDSLFLATRLSALAVMARMQKGAGVGELVSHMKKPKLSVEERLSIALDLCRLGEPSARPFFERVVESESDSIFDQLRALHGLALLGLTEYVPVLEKVVQTKTRPRAAAERILVLMGDRSRLAPLLDQAKQGDLESLKTLTLAQLMDTQKLAAPALYHEARYRTLIGQ